MTTTGDTLTAALVMGALDLLALLDDVNFAIDIDAEGSRQIEIRTDRRSLLLLTTPSGASTFTVAEVEGVRWRAGQILTPIGQLRLIAWVMGEAAALPSDGIEWGPEHEEAT